MHLVRYVSSLELHVRWDGAQWTAVLLDHGRRTAYAQASVEGGAAAVAALEIQLGIPLPGSSISRSAYRHLLAMMRFALAEQDAGVTTYTGKDTAYGQREELAGP